jgi:hypothetical protein
MKRDFESWLLGSSLGNSQQSEDDQVRGEEERAALRLKQCNFVLPEIYHTTLRKLAAECDMPLYPLARLVVLLGMYYFKTDMREPARARELMKFMEAHRSLNNDRKASPEIRKTKQSG